MALQHKKVVKIINSPSQAREPKRHYKNFMTVLNLTRTSWVSNTSNHAKAICAIAENTMQNGIFSPLPPTNSLTNKRKSNVSGITIEQGSFFLSIFILPKTLKETKKVRQNENYGNCNRMTATNGISFKPCNCGNLHIASTNSSDEKQVLHKLVKRSNL